MICRKIVSKKNQLFLLIILVNTLLFPSCREQKRNDSPDLVSGNKAQKEYRLDFARGFEVSYYKGYKVVKVNHPWKGSERSYTYVLAGEDLKEKPSIEYDAFVKIPVKSLVCTSTSHLPMLEMIGESEHLTGFPNTSLITSETYINAIKTGKIRDVGNELGTNIEVLMDIGPDLVITYGTGNEFDQLDALSRSGIPFVINADYMETDPLGRAEWIKFIACFFNKESLADSIFKDIAATYLDLKSKTGQLINPPTAFTGIMYGDTWFLPGGQNYAARFLSDAGAKYIWSDNQEDGWLELGYESVYDKAYEAEFWLGTGSFNTREEMESADHRYAGFQSFQKGNVYNYNAKMGKSGGNAYLELGYARPDMVLSDLIYILHPELIPDHQLYFYKVLP